MSTLASEQNLGEFLREQLSSLIVDCGFPAVFWECAPVYFDQFIVFLLLTDLVRNPAYFNNPFVVFLLLT